MSNLSRHPVISKAALCIWRLFMEKKTSISLFLALLSYFFTTLSPLPLWADASNGLSSGETLYVPAYSHIYSGNKERPFLLTVTLSIRNIDPKNPITLTAVDYYETQGQRIKRFLKDPILMKPFESRRYIIPEKDESGGSGANFIVTWQSDHPVNAPLAETIMIGTQGQQGISFTSRGVAIAP